MAYSQDQNLVTYTADNDFSADGTAQYRGVKLTATGFDKCGANDAGFVGVLQNDPKQGAAGTIKVDATSKAIAGAAIAIGAKVTTDANGRFVTATAGQNVSGRARSAAAASGDQFSLLIQPGGVA